MGQPAPYRPDTGDLLKHSLEQHVSLTVIPVNGEPFDLPIIHGGGNTLTLSEDWSPRAQASFTTGLPEIGNLDLLDPRARCRLQLRAGYVHRDRGPDMALLYDLHLRSRDVKRPENTLELTAASDEAYLQDYKLQWNPNVDKSGAAEALQWLIKYGMNPETPPVDANLVKYRPDLIADLEPNLGDTIWDIAADVAARTWLRVWVEPDRTWKIRTISSVTGGTPVHEITIGETGTLIDSTATLSRDEWFNAILLEYRWTDAQKNEQVVYGRAYASSPAEFTAAKAGYKVFSERYDRPATPGAAKGAAAVALRNLITRGRGLTIKAIAAYWCRPGQTIEVTLPTGETVQHIIKAITFDFDNGTMQITTRQPENITITTGE